MEQLGVFRLRALEMEDLDFIYKVENDYEIWSITDTQVPYSKYFLTNYIDVFSKDIYESKQVKLMVEYEGKSVGMVDFYDYSPKNKRGEVGIVILKEYRGKGYGAEALGMFLEYLFKVIDLHQVYAHIFSDNLSCIKIFEKNGFVRTGEKSDWVYFEGVYKDVFFYQLKR